MSDINSDEIIKSMKSSLKVRVDEWVGFDIPNEGTEDYERWQSMLLDIEDVDNINGVREYLESNGMGEFDDFLICGEWDISELVDDPSIVPIELVVNTAEEIASQQREDGSWSTVYKYGKWFVSVNEDESKFFDDVESALAHAGITEESSDDI